jgi:hypothetical protein
VPADPAYYNFEGGTQGWTASGTPIARLSISGSQKYAGAASLAVSVNGSGRATTFVANPAARAGQTVTFRVYIPSGARLASIQPFVQEGAAGGWRWTGAYRPLSQLRQGAWNSITVVVPSNASPLASMGVEITTSGKYNGTLYVDSVAF